MPFCLISKKRIKYLMPKWHTLSKSNTMNLFIDAALKGRNTIGYYVAVVILVLVANVIGSLPGGWALVTWKDTPAEIPVYAVTGLMLLGFAFSLIVLWLLMRPIHKRVAQTLINPTGVINWRRVLLSAMLWLACTAIVEIATYFVHPAYYKLSFDWSVWLPSLVLGVILIPLQSWFEEIFFRGYLLQGIGSWNLWAGVAITTIVFGLAHSFNDEVEAAGGLGIAMIYYMGFGLFAALLAIFDKSLELPMGIHAANNVYAFLLVGYPSSSLPSASIWVTTQLNFPVMLIQWILALGLYVLLARKVLNLRFESIAS
jgi:uncharacterized protein